MYIPRVGTFQIGKISSESSFDERKSDEIKFEFLPDKDQEQLQFEIIPDTSFSEATIDEFKRPKDRKQQFMIEEKTEDGEENEEDEEDEEDDGIEDNELDEDLEFESPHNELKSEIQSQIDTKYDFQMDEDLTDEQREEERLQFLEKVKQLKEDTEFPDEVELSQDEPARIRYQKFRGLKSFRTSPWDPKENLPLDYARIFQFQNFKRSQKKVFKDLAGAPVDCYYSISIVNVPSTVVEKYANDLMVVYGLLKYEQRRTLMNFQIKKVNGLEDPIKSKEELYAQIGFRTFKCNPVFSEYNPRYTKQKFDKFLSNDSFCTASFYAPVTYTPCPILFFKKDVLTGKFKLVASGATIGSDVDRIILKKIILTGHPYKSHKKQAVLRYMFFNAEDVKWFKPVEIWTKQGRTGMIKEPVGTHGSMKCQFDDVIAGNDTVCLSLYKRVFPKWTTEEVSFE